MVRFLNNRDSEVRLCPSESPLPVEDGLEDPQLTLLRGLYFAVVPTTAFWFGIIWTVKHILY